VSREAIYTHDHWSPPVRVPSREDSSLLEPLFRVSQPQAQAVDPGGSTSFVVEVKNDSDIVEGYGVELLGPPARWSAVEPASLSLFPGTSGTFTIECAPPRDAFSTAGQTVLAARVTAGTDAAQAQTIEIPLVIGQFFELGVSLAPQTSRGYHRGRHVLYVHNAGNGPFPVSVSAADPDQQLAFRVDPEQVSLNPGSHASVHIAATSSLHPLARAANYPFECTISSPDEEAPIRVPGVFHRRRVPIIPVAVGAAVALAVVLGLRLSSSEKIRPASAVHPMADRASTTTPKATPATPPTTFPPSTTTPPLAAANAPGASRASGVGGGASVAAQAAPAAAGGAAGASPAAAPAGGAGAAAATSQSSAQSQPASGSGENGANGAGGTGTSGTGGSDLYKQDVLTDNPAAFWTLGDSSWSKTAFDVSGNNDTGSYKCTTLGAPGPIVGDSSTAATFPTTQGCYMQWTPTSSQSYSGDYTVEAWFKANGTTAQPDGALFSTRTPNGEYSFDMQFAGSGCSGCPSPQTFHIDVGNGSTWLTTGYLAWKWQPGQWYDVAVTVSQETWQADIFVDGQQLGTLPLVSFFGNKTPPLLYDSTHDPSVGEGTRYIGQPTEQACNCTMADVAIYRTALSAADLATHYKAGEGQG